MLINLLGKIGIKYTILEFTDQSSHCLLYFLELFKLWNRTLEPLWTKYTVPVYSYDRNLWKKQVMHFFQHTTIASSDKTHELHFTNSSWKPSCGHYFSSTLHVHVYLAPIQSICVCTTMLHSPVYIILKVPSYMPHV